jgi:predicted lipid carrier protein YhbT
MPNHRPPPLSPVLLLGMALRPLPPRLISPLTAAAMTAMRRRHPGVFERLAPLAQSSFLIDPVDLPFAFLLRPAGRQPQLSPLSKAAALPETTAVIRGPLTVLLDLLAGKLDGDALFFSRELVIEGDTEAVLTLRNAVDSGDIDVAEDLLSLLGPFAGPARQANGLLAATYRRAAGDLETLRQALLGPLTERSQAQAAELEEIEATLAEVQTKLRRKRGPQAAAGEREGAKR